MANFLNLNFPNWHVNDVKYWHSGVKVTEKYAEDKSTRVNKAWDLKECKTVVISGIKGTGHEISRFKSL